MWKANFMCMSTGFCLPRAPASSRYSKWAWHWSNPVRSLECILWESAPITQARAREGQSLELKETGPRLTKERRCQHRQHTRAAGSKYSVNLLCRSSEEVEKTREFTTIEVTPKPPHWAELSSSFIAACMHARSCPALRPPGLQPTRLLCPWGFSGKNTGMGCHALLQGIFQSQGSNPHLLCLLHWQVNSSPLSHLGTSQALHECHPS